MRFPPAGRHNGFPRGRFPHPPVMVIRIGTYLIVNFGYKIGLWTMGGVKESKTSSP